MKSSETGNVPCIILSIPLRNHYILGMLSALSYVYLSDIIRIWSCSLHYPMNTPKTYRIPQHSVCHASLTKTFNIGFGNMAKKWFCGKINGVKSSFVTPMTSTH